LPTVVSVIIIFTEFVIGKFYYLLQQLILYDKINFICFIKHLKDGIMSYDIHVYPIELKEKTISENMNLDDVFNYIEKKQNLIAFSEEQIKLLEEHLIYRGFKLKKESLNRKDYSHSKYTSISVMVTPTGVYFNGRGDDVFEMSMTAGEFTYFGNLKGKFGVFDPSNKGWQK